LVKDVVSYSAMGINIIMGLKNLRKNVLNIRHNKNSNPVLYERFVTKTYLIL
jgi:hypothetical protein